MPNAQRHAVHPQATAEGTDFSRSRSIKEERMSEVSGCLDAEARCEGGGADRSVVERHNERLRVPRRDESYILQRHDFAINLHWDVLYEPCVHPNPHIRVCESATQPTADVLAPHDVGGDKTAS
jgi:hypothetical protein